ncbi:hypothetical protein [Rhodococcoides fascians]|uniref:hypothetical protein n=1 Tax=Rhodococcoides fascians TaxID=1828 RepID=UPI00056C811C|nr:MULTISPECIES: hypothetical protein [Rhodococcus]OZE99562.1 hypothetical protein CH301_15590 [Rhodococcus sp. 15-1189-1-1a]OZF13852.1 hypothetical protein CH299_15370 [Rhodococcus sp. 14-2686-1-2]
MNSDRTARPRVVTAAYLLWLIAAVLLVFVALITLTVPVDPLRTSLADEGNTPAQIDSYLGTLRLLGAGCGLLGLVLGFLAGPVRAGHARMRAVSVLLSLVTVLLLLVVVFGFGLFSELLAVALVLIAACVVIYRPAATPWFAHD